jgi:hypothetical protein
LVTVPLFCFGLVVTVLIILDQVVGYCSHYFGSGLFVTVPVILDQAGGYCSGNFG